MHSFIRSLLSLCLLIEAASLLVEGHDGQKDIEQFKRSVQNLRHTLDGNQINLIGELRNCVSEANGGFNVRIPSQDLPFKSIKKGIAELVKRHEHVSHKKKKSSEKFDEAFQKFVVSPCDAVIREMRSIKDEYEDLLHNQDEARDQLDMDSLEWLVNTRICFDIFTTLDEARHDAGEIALDDHYHKTKVGRLFHNIIH